MDGIVLLNFFLLFSALFLILLSRHHEIPRFLIFATKQLKFQAKKGI